MSEEDKVKERIEKKLSKIDNSKAKEEFEQEMLLDEFDDVLFRINHKHEDLVSEAVEKAKKIKVLEGWPDNKEKFWDMEAVNWKFRTPESMRDFISEELKELKGRNLDIGCGSISYVDGSVCLDISYDMLKWNKNENKVQGVCEQLPFKKDSFDSVTMVFTANYAEDLSKLVREISKVLKRDGKIICVQSAKPVHKLHQLVENKDFSVEKLMYELNKIGFRVKKEVKKTGNTELIFIEGQKL